MNYFYCPKCDKFEKDFKFDERKQRDQLVMMNHRDGYGTPITHIYCPNCKWELSGFMNISRWISEGENDGVIEYVKIIIKGYSDGSLWNVDRVLEVIRNNQNK